MYGERNVDINHEREASNNILAKKPQHSSTGRKEIQMLSFGTLKRGNVICLHWGPQSMGYNLLKLANPIYGLRNNITDEGHVGLHIT